MIGNLEKYNKENYIYLDKPTSYVNIWNRKYDVDR